MKTIAILFVLVTGPKGDPTMITQEFRSIESCQKVAVDLNKDGENISKAFWVAGRGNGTYSHGISAWCVEK